MYCGRVKEVVVFGESYVSDAPQRAVFEGQSHRNYSGQEFRSYYQRQIETETQPRPYVAAECCFLGGGPADEKELWTLHL